MRVYKYGCLPPTLGQEAVIDQHRFRVRLWNGLVELEQQRRATLETLLLPLVEAEKAALEAIVDEKSAESRAARSAYFAARKAAFARDEVKASLAELKAQTRDAARPLYTGTGIYSWNTDDVLTMWRTACQKPDPPRFRRFEAHTGMVSLRWQTGLPVIGLEEPNPMLTLLPAPSEEEWRKTHPRGKVLRSFRFRTASQDRKPVWVDVPVILHRPLPENGVIRQARLVWERVGGHVRWHICLVVDEPAVETRKPNRIALDLCWRRVPGGIRVAYTVDEAGRVQELVLPERWRAAYDRLEGVQSVRDQQFNAARDALRAWLQAAPDVPEWLRERTSHLYQWRSEARLAALCLQWRRERFHGDDAGYELLEAWRKRDRHLWEWVANGKRKLLDSRQHLYREFAAGIASQYGELVLGAFDLRKVADKEQDAKELHPAARTNRFYVAPSELRSAVQQAVTREGGVVLSVSSVDKTVTCSYCGSKVTADRAASVRCACSSCGQEWDQDWNKCRNLLAEVRKTEQKSAA